MIKLSSNTLKRSAAAPLMISALLCASCVSLLPEPAPAPSIYRLTQSPVSAEPISGAPSLRIAVPDAETALQGADVVVSPDGRRLAFAAGARWSQPIPELLQDAAMQSLAQSGNLITITPPTVVRADYTLEPVIRAFEASFDRGEEAPPLAKIRILVTLTDMKSRQVIAKKEFYGEQRATEVRVTSIVNALDSLTQTVMAEMAVWTERSLAAAPAGS